MENSDKILNIITNVKSETARIRQLVSEQFDTDFSKVWAEDAMDKRVSCLRRIWGASADMDAFCEMIRANVRVAENSRAPGLATEASTENTGELF